MKVTMMPMVPHLKISSLLLQQRNKKNVVQ
jgi:hypothetical protein